MSLDLDDSRDRRLARRRYHLAGDEATSTPTPGSVARSAPVPGAESDEATVQRVEAEIVEALARWRGDAAAAGSGALGATWFRQREREINATLERLLQTLRAACRDGEDAWERRVARLYTQAPLQPAAARR